jgi:hypothetical protein
MVVLIAGLTMACAEVSDKSPAKVLTADSEVIYESDTSLIDMDADQGTSSDSGSFDHNINSCSSNNKIWILDPACSGRRQDQSISLGRFAVLELDPGVSGYAMLFHRLPSGELQTKYLGYVYSGHRYRLSQRADPVGSHEFWYRTAWKESNRVRLDVSGKRPWHE